MTKSEKKLIKLFDEANECTSRKEAKKLILKTEKLRAKILAKQLLKDS